MTAVCIIPARGGSRRIPRKNTRLFYGKPIIAYSIETAREAAIFGRIIVSTDADYIADVALEYGAEVHRRAAGLGNDAVGTQEVTREAIPEGADYACCLYATAPMLSPSTLREAYLMLAAYPNTDYVVPVATWLRDPGQFYFGRVSAFMANRPLIGIGTRLLPIPPSTECDINNQNDWARAEAMYRRREHGERQLLAG